MVGIDDLSTRGLLFLVMPVLVAAALIGAFYAHQARRPTVATGLLVLASIPGVVIASKLMEISLA